MASNPQGTSQRGNSTRGFASVDPERQREVASEGSRAQRDPRSPAQSLADEADADQRKADQGGGGKVQRRKA